MQDILTRVHARSMVEWARDKPEVVVLSGDLTKNTEADTFRDAYPDRFFTMGLAEQNMLGVAGGLAREGYTPFVYTFGVFMYRRALDQLQMSVAYPNLRVRLLGFLPGISTPGGVTHQAIDDLAVTSTIPNMTVLATGDATEVESVLDVAQAVDGPVYVSMMRGRMPRLFPAQEPMTLGRGRVLRRGTDLLVLSTGMATEDALRAMPVLADRGVSITHMHVSTLKPFNDPQVLEALASAGKGVITFENHLIKGGLGSAVAETIAEHGLGVRLRRIGLRDTYAHGGSHDYLKKVYGLDSMALVREVEALVGRDLNISDSDLAAVRLEPEHGTHKPEAL